MKSSGKRSHEVGPRDVICQRGSFGNLHPMNKSYLEKRDEMIPHYLLAEKQRDKTIISRLLVNWVHHQGGQFIKFDRSTKTWQEISEKEALKKASQALREGILYFRRVILQDDDANDDEKRNCCPEQPVKGRALESEQDAVSEPEEKQSIIQGKDKDCEESPSSSEIKSEALSKVKDTSSQQSQDIDPAWFETCKPKKPATYNIDPIPSLTTLDVNTIDFPGSNLCTVDRSWFDDKFVVTTTSTTAAGSTFADATVASKDAAAKKTQAHAPQARELAEPVHTKSTESSSRSASDLPRKNPAIDPSWFEKGVQNQTATNLGYVPSLATLDINTLDVTKSTTFSVDRSWFEDDCSRENGTKSWQDDLASKTSQQASARRDAESKLQGSKCDSTRKNAATASKESHVLYRSWQQHFGTKKQGDNQDFLMKAPFASLEMDRFDTWGSVSKLIDPSWCGDLERIKTTSQSDIRINYVNSEDTLPFDSISNGSLQNREERNKKRSIETIIDKSNKKTRSFSNPRAIDSIWGLDAKPGRTKPFDTKIASSEQADCDATCASRSLLSISLSEDSNLKFDHIHPHSSVHSIAPACDIYKGNETSLRIVSDLHEQHYQGASRHDACSSKSLDKAWLKDLLKVTTLTTGDVYAIPTASLDMDQFDEVFFGPYETSNLKTYL